MTEKVVIYTDGGAEPNPGYGGWGAVLLHPGSGRSRELSGSDPDTTNNRMELMAAIEGLAALKSACAVDLFTDSAYLKRGIKEWLPRWKGKNWRRRDGSPVKNADLWRRLDEMAHRHDIEWHWVKGHAGDEYNERADALATAQIRAQRDKAEPKTSATSRRDFEVLLKLTCNRERGAWMARVRGVASDETLSGEASGVTTNQLELRAAEEILRQLPAESSVAVTGGSDYLRQGASRWMGGWKRSGWRTREGNAVKNAELWKALDAQLARRDIEWRAPRVGEREEIKELGRRLKERPTGDG